MVIQVFTCAFYMIERKGGLSLFIDDVDFYNKIIVLVFSISDHSDTCYIPAVTLL